MSNESESVMNLLKDRYFLSKESTWEHIAERVSDIYPPIKSAIENKEFIPSTPTLFNANTKGERFGTLSSCFPMSIEDSIVGIFESLKEAAIVTKMGGGVGYDFSNLRSTGENVDSINRPSGGPIPFMKIFNSTLDGIQQGGVRRGAGMALMSIYHPDILKFIEIKQDIANKKEKENGKNEMERMNLSVKIPDSFYKTLKNNPESHHKVKDVKTGKSYSLKDKNGNFVTVKDIWNKIVHSAWKVAEPGIFNETIAFDRCTSTNVDKTVICNPCSEYVNIPYSACSLGSINLAKFVKNNEVNWESLGNIVRDATKFLNNTIDINNYPIEKIKQVNTKIRPIGLGIMGLATLFFKLGIPYNSNKAIKLSEEIARYITLKSMQTSVEIAKENKKSYESFDYNLFMKANERFFNKNCRDIDIEKLKKDIHKYGIYNSCFTSFAPTGSIATIANVTNGIEPVFALAFTRNIEKLNKEYEKMYIVDPTFEEYVNKNFPDKKAKIFEEVSSNGGSCQKCEDIPEKDRKVFITANELTVSEHLDILEALANNVSLSISKTINLPNSAKEEEIEKVFLDAHNRGIIGVTVYRDGCRGEGILVRDNSQKKISIQKNDAPKRPKELPCDIYHVKISKKLDKVRTLEYIVLVGLYEGTDPYEVFAFENGKLDKKYTKGKIVKKTRGKYDLELEDGTKLSDISGDQTADEETITRAFSAELRHGVDPEFIVHQIEKSREEMSSFVKSIGRALKKYIKDGVKVSGVDCPTCLEKGQKANIVRESGCITCKTCNWSKCG